MDQEPFKKEKEDEDGVKKGNPITRLLAWLTKGAQKAEKNGAFCST